MGNREAQEMMQTHPLHFSSYFERVALQLTSERADPIVGFILPLHPNRFQSGVLGRKLASLWRRLAELRPDLIVGVVVKAEESEDDIVKGSSILLGLGLGSLIRPARF